MPDSSMGSILQKRIGFFPTSDEVSDAPRLVRQCANCYVVRQRSMKASYHLIKPEDLSWRPSNLMRIPNADYLERTGSENLSARLWRMPPKSANTLHKHIRQEELDLVLEATGR